MGRPPTHGAPAFRFLPSEVATMESVLHAHGNALPTREFLEVLAHRFSESAYRKGKTVVQMKQVWNWFQNKRAAIRAKLNKNPGKLNILPLTRGQSSPFQTDAYSSAAFISVPLPVPTSAPALAFAPIANFPVRCAGKAASNTCYREFEARSSRDGAWYDVASFLSHRFLKPGDPDVLVRFAGFGTEEDDWVNIHRHVRLRSSPCESSECVLVLPGDPILCFQERKEKALYFDAHVLDVQRRTHDFRGCRCRFLVQYDHDQSQEVVPLRKICRRPESDIRLQRMHTIDEPTMDPQNISAHSSMGGASKVSSPASTLQDQQNSEAVVTIPDTCSNMSGTVESKSPDLKASGTSSAINTGNSGDSTVDAVLKAVPMATKIFGSSSENVKESEI